MNAILYVVKGGIQWRLMPNDFPPWQTVYDHFSRWNKRGVREKCLDKLALFSRQKAGRCAVPSYGIIDAQNVKTQYASEERGIDGGKKVKGHKRHIAVDILGNLLHVKVHAANVSDTKSACTVSEGVIDKYPSLKAFSTKCRYLYKPQSISALPFNELRYLGITARAPFFIICSRIHSLS